MPTNDWSRSLLETGGSSPALDIQFQLTSIDRNLTYLPSLEELAMLFASEEMVVIYRSLIGTIYEDVLLVWEEGHPQCELAIAFCLHIVEIKQLLFRKISLSTHDSHEPLGFFHVTIMDYDVRDHGIRIIHDRSTQIHKEAVSLPEIETILQPLFQVSCQAVADSHAIPFP